MPRSCHASITSGRHSTLHGAGATGTSEDIYGESDLGARVTGWRDGTLRDALFDHPDGLAFDSDLAQLYVADSNNHVIRLVSATAVDESARCNNVGGLC